MELLELDTVYADVDDLALRVVGQYNHIQVIAPTKANSALHYFHPPADKFVVFPHSKSCAVLCLIPRLAVKESASRCSESKQVSQIVIVMG